MLFLFQTCCSLNCRIFEAKHPFLLCFAYDSKHPNIQRFANHLHEDLSRETSLTGSRTFLRNQVQLCKAQLVVLTKLNYSLIKSSMLCQGSDYVAVITLVLMSSEYCKRCNSDHNYSNHNHSKIYRALWF